MCLECENYGEKCRRCKTKEEIVEQMVSEMREKIITNVDSLTYEWTPTPEIVIRYVACRGMESKISEYDTKLMIEEQGIEPGEEVRALEIRQERKFIRKLLKVIDIGGCIAETAKCFEGDY